MKVPKGVLSALKEEERFVLAVHVNPDGDAIGSALALSFALESLGKETLIYSKDPIPPQYTFLPGHEKIGTEIGNTDKNSPALILLDCNSPERAGLGKVWFRRSLVIDHHKTESDFGDLAWIESEAAATGMMVYSIIKTLGVKITREMAFSLYTAICIDTGTFRYLNTSAEVISVALDLVKSGAEPGTIASRLYETWREARFKLLIMTLNTLEIRSKVAMTHVTKEMMRRTGTNANDTENFSSIPRIMETVKISALFREVPGKAWKVSLRSKGEVDVACIAEKFGGGGHKNAAGFQIEGDLQPAKRALIATVRKCLVLK